MTLLFCKSNLYGPRKTFAVSFGVIEVWYGKPRAPHIYHFVTISTQRYSRTNHRIYILENKLVSSIMFCSSVTYISFFFLFCFVLFIFLAKSLPLHFFGGCLLSAYLIFLLKSLKCKFHITHCHRSRIYFALWLIVL